MDHMKVEMLSIGGAPTPDEVWANMRVILLAKGKSEVEVDAIIARVKPCVTFGKPVLVGVVEIAKPTNPENN